MLWKGEPMALNNLEDRLECAISHINTSVDIDPWAQSLAVESMRMRIALMKGEQPEIIRCKDCKYWQDQEEGVVEVPICARPENKYEKFPLVMLIGGDGFCSYAERREDATD